MVSYWRLSASTDKRDCGEYAIRRTIRRAISIRSHCIADCGIQPRWESPGCWGDRRNRKDRECCQSETAGRRIHDSPNGRVPSNADRVVFSPDGKLLAVHGYSNAAWLLDVQTGEPRVTFEPNKTRLVPRSEIQPRWQIGGHRIYGLDRAIMGCRHWEHAQRTVTSWRPREDFGV